MLDHLVHGAVLEESALFVAVLAVVVVDGAIGIGPAIFLVGEGHAAALAELGQLARGEVLFLPGEGGLVGFEGLRLVIGYEITLGRAVGGLGDAVGLEPSGDELLRQEVGDLGVGRLGVVVDAQAAGQAEACVLVEFEVAFHAQEADACFARLVQGVSQQFESVALALVIRVDADRTEGPGRFAGAVRQLQAGFREHDMADEPAVFFHNEVQFGDEVRIAAVLVQDKVLRAAGTVYVPE